MGGIFFNPIRYPLADIEPAHAIGMITILKSRDVSTSESVDYQCSQFS